MSFVKINKITAQGFKAYGRVIEYAKNTANCKTKSLFCIVHKENRLLGWRIAYLIVRDKVLKNLEQHPDSFESFEPVKGRALLYLANSKNPRKIKGFYLDRPVVLKKGIWHGVIVIDNEAEIKITENAKVECVYWSLGFELR